MQLSVTGANIVEVLRKREKKFPRIIKYEVRDIATNMSLGNLV